MKLDYIGIAVICLVFSAFLVLIFTLPISWGVGSGSNDGTGYQYGDNTFQNGTGQGCQQTFCQNVNCASCKNCPKNQVQPQGGTGQRCGESVQCKGSCGLSGGLSRCSVKG